MKAFAIFCLIVISFSFSTKSNNGQFYEIENTTAFCTSDYAPGFLQSKLIASNFNISLIKKGEFLEYYLGLEIYGPC